MERPRRRRPRSGRGADSAADGGPRDGQPQNGQPQNGQPRDYTGAGAGYGDERHAGQGGPGGELIPADQASADALLPERVAELASEISEAHTEPRRRRLTMALPRLANFPTRS